MDIILIKVTFMIKILFFLNILSFNTQMCIQSSGIFQAQIGVL